MNKTNIKFQWAQLVVLTGAHFLVDMFGGILPPILPKIETEFAITALMGSYILVTMNLTCNGVQLLSGRLRKHEITPNFLKLGLLIAPVICLMAAMPRQPYIFPLLICLAIISGIGIAIAHPEGLRAVHILHLVPSSTSTSFFMAGGFFGYASGSWISALLVAQFGLPGLYPLCVLSILAVFIIIASKIHLAVETEPSDNTHTVSSRQPQLPFSLVLAIALPLTTASTIIVWLLPRYLQFIGFPQTFAGFSTMVFGCATAIGSFFWARLADKTNKHCWTSIALLAGIPFLFLYFLTIHHRNAVWLLFLAGLCSPAAFPLIVNMARHAAGPDLGQRMGLIVGGSWGFASLFYLLTIYIQNLAGFSIMYILIAAPLCYLLSAIIASFVPAKASENLNKIK